MKEESRRMRHDQYLRGSRVGESSKGRGKIGERACAIKERSDGFKLGRRNGGGRGLIESWLEKGDMKGVKRIRRQGESEK